MVYHTTEQILGLVPVAAAAGIATRTLRGSLGPSGTRKRRAAVPTRRKPVARRKRVVARKRTVARPKAVTRKRRVSAAPPGHWNELSWSELVRLVGSKKAQAIKGKPGAVVKVGLYDKFVYFNGKYYIG